MNTHSSFELTSSRNFTGWLSQQGCSIVFSTYQGGKFFLLGVKPNGALSVFERDFPRCMGIGVANESRTLFLATHYQIFRMDNFIPIGGEHNSFDAVFSPTQSWFTGDVDAHDVAVTLSGSPIFANTAFNCVASLVDGHSFQPYWLPPFIDKLTGEDRCHLNGIAMDAGELVYVTCASKSNVFEGWRDEVGKGGLVVDVNRNEIVADGLSMPHSPRLNDGRLWLLNSGSGEFGSVDLQSGRFQPLAFCPGFARGLSFSGRFAVIGLSKLRQGRTFGALALDDELTSRKTGARCGIMIVDTETGSVVEWVRIEGPISELYDIAVIPGVNFPSAIGLKGGEVARTLSIGKLTDATS